jgi:Na+/proline symporter
MLIVLVALLGIAANYLPAGDGDRLWLCWHSLSAAFGPLLLVRLTGKKVRPGSSLGAMWSGFVLTVLFHLMPDTPGDLLERCLPFIAAMGIALSGGEQRRNPNRADRGDKTVHDHLPI